MDISAIIKFSTVFNSFEDNFHYIILGIIQGLTEFIPISSTAHLKAIPFFLGWEDPGVSVTASLQLGSIIASISYFWQDLAFILRGISIRRLSNKWKNQNTKFSFSILIGTLPIIFVGMVIKLFWSGYESSSIRSIPFIAIISIMMALILLIAEIFGSRKKTLDRLTVKDGLFIGCAQVLALIPGVSRSGITITSALMRGIDRESAARFSFVLGIPAITLAGLVELKEMFISNESFSVIPLLLGIISSGITSWLAIDFLLKFLQKNTMMIFITYRVLFGGLLLVWYY